MPPCLLLLWLPLVLSLDTGDGQTFPDTQVVNDFVDTSTLLALIRRQEEINAQQSEQLRQLDNVIRDQNNVIRDQREHLNRMHDVIRDQEQINRRAAEVDRVVVARSDDPVTSALVERLAARVSKLDADVAGLQAAGAQHGHDLAGLQAAERRHDDAIKGTLPAAINASAVSTFVRWGSSPCGANADLVYSGVVGGSPYNDVNACLTMDPIFSDLHLTAYTVLAGTEYRTHGADSSGHSLYQDPVCSVCVARQPATIMIPGTTQCGSGWTKHYSGLLMAEEANGNSAGSEFICVDSSFEARPGSAESKEDGGLLYLTKAKCGSLPCGPYVNGKIITCVVCSK